MLQQFKPHRPLAQGIRRNKSHAWMAQGIGQFVTSPIHQMFIALFVAPHFPADGALSGLVLGMGMSVAKRDSGIRRLDARAGAVSNASDMSGHYVANVVNKSCFLGRA